MSDPQSSGPDMPSTDDQSKIDLLSDELDSLKSRVGIIEEGLSIQANSERETHSPETSSDKKTANTSVLDYLNKNEYCDLVISKMTDIRKIAYTDKVTTSSQVRVLIPEALIEKVQSRFPLNAKFRSQTVQDNVDLRTVDTDLDIPLALIITESTIVCQMNFGSAEPLVEGNSDLHNQLRSEYDDIFTSSEEVDLGIPPWEEVLHSLEEVTTPETATVFERLGNAVPPEKSDSVDSVVLTIFAAAQTGALQYDISKWGEEIGIGSSATFSRRKSKLEKDDVITTTKEPVDTGRPRFRLHWGPNAESYMKETFSEAFATSGLETDNEYGSTTDPNSESVGEETLAEIVEEFI